MFTFKSCIFNVLYPSLRLMAIPPPAHVLVSPPTVLRPYCPHRIPKRDTKAVTTGREMKKKKRKRKTKKDKEVRNL